MLVFEEVKFCGPFFIKPKAMSLVSKLLMQKILTGKTMSTATWELTLCENQLHLINQKFRKMLTGNRLLEERLLF